MFLFRLLSRRPHSLFRYVHTSAPAFSQQLPPRIKIDENDITENFIKGGGSGGQKINKTSSQVQLIHHPTGIHIKCQATRSRSQNRTQARRILAERIEELQMGQQSRTAIKAEKEKKKKANSVRKSRKKYKKLAEEKGMAEQEDSIPDESNELQDSKESTKHVETRNSRAVGGNLS